jgi:hypothetical protein
MPEAEADDEPHAEPVLPEPEAPAPALGRERRAPSWRRHLSPSVWAGAAMLLAAIVLLIAFLVERR